LLFPIAGINPVYFAFKRFEIVFNNLFFAKEERLPLSAVSSLLSMPSVGSKLLAKC
jgi:hypothetical protein